MNKLWLIVKREYLTRVKKRAFILTTLLLPLGIMAFIAVVGVIFSYNEDNQRIAVIDDSGFEIRIKSSDKANFVPSNKPLDELKTSYVDEGFNGILYIPEINNLSKKDYSIKYFSENQMSITTKEFIERRVASRIRELKIEKSEVDPKLLESFDTDVDLDEKALTVDDSGNVTEESKSNNAGIATILGMIMGFIIYVVLFIYGTMVMRSVMEEKTNRIVEVMISSVKPFQLMLGKIIGVGAVGITQLLIWVILVPAVQLFMGLFIDLDPASMQAAQGVSPEQTEDMTFQIVQILESLAAQNWALIIPMFLFYFFGGYVIYASMFAAVGSAIGDDLGEGQSLTFPITIPVILAIYIMFAVIDNPNSSLATWSSLFPLFSPIVMPARIPFEPPFWEVALSMVILAASAVFFVWLSGRIYRVGILMYGKKVSFRELGKWMFYRD
jgi:ABC-2 type transport system permease protein